MSVHVRCDQCRAERYTAEPPHFWLRLQLGKNRSSYEFCSLICVREYTQGLISRTPEGDDWVDNGLRVTPEDTPPKEEK
jgi:hypothetical protein